MGAFRIKRQAQRLTFFILGKRRMRSKFNALSDRDRVDGIRNVLAVGLCGQHVFVRIKIHGLDNFFGCQRHERIGALQVFVPVERLINPVGVDRFIARIGHLRIERFGTAPRKGSKKRVGCVVGERSRSIDRIRAARRQRRCGKR